MDIGIILGTSRQNGHTHKFIEKFVEKTDAAVYDLVEYHIVPYD